MDSEELAIMKKVSKGNPLDGREAEIVCKCIRLQIPREPAMVNDEGKKRVVCPNCSRWIGIIEKFKPALNRYCPSCGQLLNWNMNILQKMAVNHMIIYD